MTTYTGYQGCFAEIAPDLNPRHVEAYMRLQYGTLDHLSRDRFRFEIENGGPDGSIRAAIAADPTGAEDLAKSYGL